VRSEAPRDKSRSLAIVLSLIVPGLGHFYLRRWATGAFFLVASIVVLELLGTAVPLNSLTLDKPPPLGGLIAALVVLLALAGACLWDVYRLTRPGDVAA
jgi:hypothetical protein